MNCSKQMSHVSNDISLTRKTRGNYERRQTRGLALKKIRNQFGGEEPSHSCYRETTEQDFDRSQLQIDVLQAYGIIPAKALVPAQGCISSCYGRTVDLTKGLATAPSNIKAIIAGFLG